MLNEDKERDIKEICLLNYRRNVDIVGHEIRKFSLDIFEMLIRF